MSHPDMAAVLDAAADLVANDGVSSVTVSTLAHRTGRSEKLIVDLIGSSEEAIAKMISREFEAMWGRISDNIERDPRGGMLSRIYVYLLSAVYENPVVRALYFNEPQSLNRIARSAHGLSFQPDTDARTVFITRMQEAGMVRAVDARQVAAMLDTLSAGLAVSSPGRDFDLVIEGLEKVLIALVDTEGIVDTTPGKQLAYEYAVGLANRGTPSR